MPTARPWISAYPTVSSPATSPLAHRAGSRAITCSQPFSSGCACTTSPIGSGHTRKPFGDGELRTATRGGYTTCQWPRGPAVG